MENVQTVQLEGGDVHPPNSSPGQEILANRQLSLVRFDKAISLAFARRKHADPDSIPSGTILVAVHPDYSLLISEDGGGIELIPWHELYYHLGMISYKDFLDCQEAFADSPGGPVQ